MPAWPGRSPAIRDHVIAARAIQSVCALGFLGLGVSPPAPEWGALLADGRSHMGAAPLVMIGPGATILVGVLLINLAGDWMRDRVALDEVRTA